MALSPKKLKERAKGFVHLVMTPFDTADVHGTGHDTLEQLYTEGLIRA